MGASYCSNCKSWMVNPVGETCSAFCRDALELRRAQDAERVPLDMSPAAKARALEAFRGEVVRQYHQPVNAGMLDRALAAEPPADSMFSEIEVQTFFGTDIGRADQLYANAVAEENRQRALRDHGGLSWAAVIAFCVIFWLGIAWLVLS